MTGWWIVFGLAGGIGIENKPSMVVFLVALLIGLLLTPQRRIVFTRGAVSVSRSSFCSRCPTCCGRSTTTSPHSNSSITARSITRTSSCHRLQFLGAQVMMLNPLSLPLWFAGVIWLLVSRRSREWRFLGWTYLVFLALMFATRDAKDYYLAAIYPAIFAAGGIAGRDC